MDVKGMKPHYFHSSKVELSLQNSDKFSLTVNRWFFLLPRSRLKSKIMSLDIKQTIGHQHSHKQHLQSASDNQKVPVEHILGSPVSLFLFLNTILL